MECIWEWNRRAIAYEALVGMDMAREDDIYAGPEEQVLHGSHHPDRLILLLVIAVGVVPRRVDNRDEPRRSPPVDLRQIRLQPSVLLGAGLEVSVRP